MLTDLSFKSFCLRWTEAFCQIEREYLKWLEQKLFDTACERDEALEYIEQREGRQT